MHPNRSNYSNIVPSYWRYLAQVGIVETTVSALSTMSIIRFRINAINCNSNSLLSQWDRIQYQVTIDLQANGNPSILYQLCLDLPSSHIPDVCKWARNRVRQPAFLSQVLMRHNFPNFQNVWKRIQYYLNVLKFSSVVAQGLFYTCKDLKLISN